MKYKLINSVAKTETICDKITIDGYDYYFGGDYKDGDYVIPPLTNTLVKCINGTTFIEGTQKVIATTNPNIDIPKVVDMIQQLASDVANNSPSLTEDRDKVICFTGWIDGYLKSKETYSNSDEDMIEFAEWCSQNSYKLCANGEWILLGTGEYKSVAKSTKELLQLWKEQKPKTIYYE